MVNRLKLSGNELMAYAAIYGFSQDGESKYEGSGQYLANSLGISRRAVSMLLSSLVEKHYVKKTDGVTENGVKYCHYQAAAEFFPGNDAAGGMEKISIPMEKNSAGGMENSAININSYININKAAAASDPPDSAAQPPPPGETPAAAPFTPRELEAAALSMDKKLVLGNFYPQAAAFMARHSLDLKYLPFIYKQTELKNPSCSFDGMYYRLFFADDMVQKYKTVTLPAAHPPPPAAVACPACGAERRAGEACPSCGLPDRPLPGQILLYRALQEFPPEKRDEYFRREEAIAAECGKDFVKRKSLLDRLNREFGLEESA